MSLLIQYLVKLSISLTIVWLFYQFVLRRLTFYNSNRWYLFGYTLLSFFIPFINVSPVLEKNEAAEKGIVQLIPSVQQYTSVLEEATHCPVPIWSTNYDKWDWMAFALMTGAGIMLLRFIFRFISFLRMQRKAKLIFADGVRLYQVNENIIPFSFGNSVFINSQLHTESEMKEIIRHEFIHVKQNHTVDIIWAEILCILNWYNPVAWLLKAAIRQNLEFIADNKVLENGINKKEYQYLLLKVIGNDQFSIAQKFNFSSLKKRIAMMNKMRTARIHLLRFLFILPLLAVILISFRQKKQEAPMPSEISNNSSFALTDTIPDEPNEKGYIVEVTGKKNNATVVVKDKNGKVVERVAYSKWKDNEKFYVDKYGEWPAPPTPPLPPTPPSPPTAPTPMELPANVTKIEVNNKKATVVLKDGSVEKYDLEKSDEKAAFEKKYGEIITPAPPMPPVPARGRHELSATQEVNRSNIAEDFDITDNKAYMRLKDGTVEEYNLADPKEREKFETKYGRIIGIGSNGPNGEAPVKAINIDNGQSVIAPMNPRDGGVIWLDSKGQVISGEAEVLVTITKKTKPDELELLKKEMKEKGIELKFDNTDYNDGVLVAISGTIKLKDSHGSFSATDFSKLILSTVKNDGRVYFKVDVVERRPTKVI